MQNDTHVLVSDGTVFVAERIEFDAVDDRHLLADHGYRSLAYLAGLADSPDSVARWETLKAEAAAFGATMMTGPRWQGNYYAAGGARVIERVFAEGAALPRAIACANDAMAERAAARSF